MEALEFAQLIGVHPLAVKCWLHYGQLTENMLTPDGAKEFLDLKRRYKAVCCPYLTKDQFVRAAGMPLGTYNRGSTVIYDGKHILATIPVHHTVLGTDFYTVKELRRWFDNHKMVSYIGIQRLLGVSHTIEAKLFKSVGLKSPADKLAPSFNREDIERVFESKLIAFSKGSIIGVSVEEKKNYTSFKEMEEYDWSRDDLLRICMQDASYYPDLVLDDDFYLSSDIERSLTHDYFIFDGVVQIPDWKFAKLVGVTKKVLRDKNASGRFKSYSNLEDTLLYTEDQVDKWLSKAPKQVDNVATQEAVRPEEYYKKHYYSRGQLARILGVSDAWLKSRIAAGEFLPEIQFGNNMYYSVNQMKGYRYRDEPDGAAKYMFIGEVAAYMRATPRDVRAYGDYGLIPAEFMYDKIPLYLRKDVYKFARSSY